MSEFVTLIEGMGLALLVKGEVYKFVTTVFGKSAEEVSGILSNEVRCFNAQRTAQALLKSYKALKEAGIEPQKVQLKTLIPLLEGISLEEDEELQKRWTNLLTSAIAVGKIHPSFPNILSEVDQTDAKVLDHLFNSHRMLQYKLDELQPGEILFGAGMPGISASMFEEFLKLDQSLLRVSLSNLVRLNLSTEKDYTHQRELNIDPKIYVRYSLSPLGIAFMEAVAVPTLPR
jgi:hypothetical protein